MTLEQLCESLPEDKQIRLAIDLINISIPVWKEYSQLNVLSYRDTVVGLTHTIPKELLQDTINEIENYLERPNVIPKIQNRQRFLKLFSLFSDPIVALQDNDWNLPHAAERIFYSVYNLIRSMVETDLKVFTISVSINQAIDAIQSSELLTADQIKQILEEARNGR